MTTKATSRNVTAEIAFLTRALKAPSLAAAVERLAERARAESWTHEEFLAACLQREVAARESHGGEGRVRAARFPARKALEDFDFDHQRTLKRDTITHLGTLDFVTGKENVVFLGPPGTGKTHLSIGLGIRACQAGHRVAFATAAQWVARLADAHHAGRLQDELVKLGRVPLLIVDEVGYIPFEAEAANLFFQLVSSRYERASLIVTSNKPFGRWGEVFGDDIVAAAMIDRLVHHAEVISLKGDSYRLKGPRPRPRPRRHQDQRLETQPERGQHSTGTGGQDSSGVDTCRSCRGFRYTLRRAELLKKDVQEMQWDRPRLAWTVLSARKADWQQDRALRQVAPVPSHRHWGA